MIKEENLLKMKPVEGSNRPSRKDTTILKNTKHRQWAFQTTTPSLFSKQVSVCAIFLHIDLISNGPILFTY